MNRRKFISASLSASIGATMYFPRSTKAADSTIDVLLNEPIATINPNIYGHFVEHLGAVVYDGIWVGEGSKIPNYFGIRKDVVDAFKKLRPSLIRYPGGCFADSYDWRDGIGQRAKRPKRTNFWQDVNTKEVPADSASRFEPNHFGTNEFLKFCRLVGAKPYLAANLRSLPPQVFNEWVEYCNSPAGSTTLAMQRATGSMPSKEPYNVEFWGIGNESWGCGGNLTPDEYAQEFRRFTAAVPTYGIPLKFIGAGGSSNDFNWTRNFFAKMREKGEGIFGKVYGWGVHHYSWNVSGGRTNDWVQGKGDAVKFNTEQYFELIKEGDELENFLTKHWQIMGEYDRSHRVKIVVDEWGSWHAPGTELKPEHLLGQQNTMRDAILAGLTLDMFNRNSDKVVMGNLAQLSNCLQSLFMTDGDKFLLTPTYRVFEMFLPHFGAESLRTVFTSPQIMYERNGKPAKFWGLNGSASRNGKNLTLTVTNPSLTDDQETEITIHGGEINSVIATVLKAADIHSHNTFANPNEVKTTSKLIEKNARPYSFRFPASSVTRLEISLK